MYAFRAALEVFGSRPLFGNKLPRKQSRPCWRFLNEQLTSVIQGFQGCSEAINSYPETGRDNHQRFPKST